LPNAAASLASAASRYTVTATLWAERAKTVGYPERFAQEALGHNSKAVHRAYAKRALMKIPSLGEYEGRALAPMSNPDASISRATNIRYVEKPTKTAYSPIGTTNAFEVSNNDFTPKTLARFPAQRGAAGTF
jgi:hypothetical protein